MWDVSEFWRRRQLRGGLPHPRRRRRSAPGDIQKGTSGKDETFVPTVRRQGGGVGAIPRRRANLRAVRRGSGRDALRQVSRLQRRRGRDMGVELHVSWIPLRTDSGGSGGGRPQTRRPFTPQLSLKLTKCIVHNQ